MKFLFKSIGLYDEFIFETEISKTQFLMNLKKFIYKSDFSIFEIADYSIPNRFEYRGLVNDDDFMIRRRRHFFDNNIQNPIIRGLICEQNGITLIKIELSPSNDSFIKILILLSFLSIILLNFNKNDDVTFILISILMLIIQYFILKRNIKKSKYDFKRELTFIAQKK
ncbi:hypothetical protein K0U91_12450 [Chryseobacterium chendengshani]|uniref:hypothetical protein n=1 Tax=Chryseobacterium sp. LJ668 TaxID=2864040 RepID=UPI001C68AE00|nr:hypothetical protein [Chryseobacterium sp. LJ668]MBW8523580.1 hypothetical protein [Chryseobacterium sp. LJ668]QYK15863.1 hypothetical protein K0U91_12450 [Chryseobacterium sp. LJ668]